MNFWSKSKNIIFIVTAIILAVWAFSLSKREKNVVSLYNRWDKLMLVLSQIEHNYVDTIDQKKIVEKLLPQLLEQLDPHSVYLPPVALEKATESLEGNFNGIGIQFNIPNDTAVVINVISGAPPSHLGLH